MWEKCRHKESKAEQYIKNEWVQMGYKKWVQMEYVCAQKNYTKKISGNPDTTTPTARSACRSKRNRCKTSRSEVPKNTH